MVNPLLITIDPPLRCQYAAYCTAQTDRAIIHTNGLQPIRWIMTPVCPQCLHSALVNITPPKEAGPCQSVPLTTSMSG